MVDGSSLENWRRRKSTVSSNLTLSAKVYFLVAQLVEHRAVNSTVVRSSRTEEATITEAVEVRSQKTDHLCLMGC